MGACSSVNKTTDTQKQNKNAKVENTKTDTSNFSSENDSSSIDSSDGVIAREIYKTDWSEDWNGLVTKITDVSIAKMEKASMEEYGMDGDGLVGVKFTIENTSDKDFNTYPDQGTLVIDGQQIEASMIASEHIGGDILKGVKKEGVIAFIVPTLNDVTAISELRLKWNSNFDTDNYEEESYKNNDITIKLK